MMPCRSPSLITSAPREPKQGIDLDELYPEGIHERDLALAPIPEAVTLREFFLCRPSSEPSAYHGIHPFRQNGVEEGGRTVDAGTLRRFRKVWPPRRYSTPSSRSKPSAIPTRIPC